MTGRTFASCSWLPCRDCCCGGGGMSGCSFASCSWLPCRDCSCGRGGRCMFASCSWLPCRDCCCCCCEGDLPAFALRSSLPCRWSRGDGISLSPITACCHQRVLLKSPEPGLTGLPPLLPPLLPEEVAARAAAAACCFICFAAGAPPAAGAAAACWGGAAAPGACPPPAAAPPFASSSLSAPALACPAAAAVAGGEAAGAAAGAAATASPSGAANAARSRPRQGVGMYTPCSLLWMYKQYWWTATICGTPGSGMGTWGSDAGQHCCWHDVLPPHGDDGGCKHATLSCSKHTSRKDGGPPGLPPTHRGVVFPGHTKLCGLQPLPCTPGTGTRQVGTAARRGGPAGGRSGLGNEASHTGIRGRLAAACVQACWMAARSCPPCPPQPSTAAAALDPAS